MPIKVHKKLFLFILLTGIFIRFLGINPGHNPYHPDEGRAGYSSAWQMFIQRNLNPIDYTYPTLIPLLELSSIVLIYLPLAWIKFALTSPSLVVHNLSHLNDFFPTLVVGQNDIPLMYWGRYLTAFVSSLILILTYLYSKRLFKDNLAALLAMLILAVNFRVVMNSHFDLPDIFNTFFLLLSYLAALNLLNNPNLKAYILGGLAVGLSFSTKLQFFSIIPFIVAQIFLLNHHKIKVNTDLLLKISCAVFIAVSVIILVNYNEIINFNKFFQYTSYASLRYGLGVFHFNFYAYQYLYNTMVTPLIAVCALFGIFISLKINAKSSLMILSSLLAILFYFTYLTWGGIYTRNLISIIPLISILAGLTLSYLYKFMVKLFPQKYLRSTLFVIVLLIILLNSLCNIFVHIKYYLKPWSMTVMKNWLEINLEPNTTLAIFNWDKHILLPDDKFRNIKYISLDPDYLYNLAELQEAGANRAILGLDIPSSRAVWWIKDQKINPYLNYRDISSNLFTILSFRELINFTIFSAVKPSQAPDNNYVFVRIPPKVSFNSQVINEYHFNQREEFDGWQKIDGFLGKGNNLNWDKEEGKELKGSLHIYNKKILYPFIRLISPPFSVDTSYIYQANVWVKSSPEVNSQKRNGFLRIDFYQNLPLVWNESTMSLSTNLSTRYFGDNNWKKLTISAKPPLNAKFATISFQVENPISSDFWIDDIFIQKSVKKVSLPDRKNNEFMPIFDEELFPFSIGNM